MISKRQMQRLSMAGVVVGWLVLGPSQALAGNVALHETHTNNDSLGRSAIGFEFDVQIPVDHSEDYWIELYDIDVTDNNTTNPLGGNRNDTFSYNSKGKIWKIHVKYSNIVPPVLFQGKVTIDADLQQNDDSNEAYIVNMRFQYTGLPEFVIVVPDHGYGYPTLPRFGSGPHNTTFTFYNLSAAPIAVDQFQFWLCDTWCGHDLPNCACIQGAPFLTIAGPINVPAASGHPIALNNIPETNGYIYAKLDVSSFGGPGTAWYYGHEDAVHALRRLGIPTLSAWGVACMTLVLLAAGAVVVHKRAKNATC